MSPFPTVFAKTIGQLCHLYIDDEEARFDNKMLLYLELKERMIVFQQIAVASNFETALQAYYDHALTDEQITYLKIIHETTKSWLLGYVAGNLLDSLSSSLLSGRDKKEIASMLVEHFIKPESTSTEATKGLLIKFAGNTNIPKLITKQEEEDDK